MLGWSCWLSGQGALAWRGFGLLLESAVAQGIIAVGGSVNAIQLLTIGVRLEQHPVVPIAMRAPNKVQSPHQGAQQECE